MLRDAQPCDDGSLTRGTPSQGVVCAGGAGELASGIDLGLMGARAGLAGLGERAALAGGRLECGPVVGDGFRLVAWLPWPV